MWTDRFTSSFSSSPQVHQGRNHDEAQTTQTNTGISSGGWSMVLIVPRLWVGSLYGPFTSELDSLGVPSSSEDSVIL